MLKNLKSLFIIEDEEAKKPVKGKKQAADQPKKQASSTKTTASTTSTPATPSPGKVSSKFINILLKAMDSNNLEGFDYLEFKQSLKSLEKMPMDDATRYQSAFAMAQTMGATPQKLMETANHYLKILATEEKKFEQALVAQRQKQIGSKESQIKKLEEIVTSKATQIKQLTKEIEEHQKQSNVLKKEIGGAVVKVESTKNDFIASYKKLIGQINADVENMKKYLK